MLATHKLNLTKGVLHELRLYAWNKKEEKRCIAIGKDQIFAARAKRAVQRWHLRTQRTIDSRENRRKGIDGNYARLYTRRCFEALDSKVSVSSPELLYHDLSTCHIE